MFKNNKKKYIIITSILILIFIILPFCFIFIYNLLNKPSGKENITTKLTNESDFLNWFIDFDNLYNKKIKSPTYSLNKEPFEIIYNFLTKNEDSNIYFQNNTYYINNDITIELDTNSKSFRYTKYEKNKNDSNNENNKLEILEVNLLNGKYYVQLINKDYLYKISFNKDNNKNKKYKNKENKIIIENSIFNSNSFKW